MKMYLSCLLGKLKGNSRGRREEGKKMPLKLKNMLSCSWDIPKHGLFAQPNDMKYVSSAEDNGSRVDNV